MSDREAQLRQQLEKEAEAWIKEEHARRYQKAKETLEQQCMESEKHLKATGISDTSNIAVLYQKRRRNPLVC